MTTLILYGLICCLGIQLYFWYHVFIKILIHKPQDYKQQNISIPATVIVCARNEAENLKKNLPRILTQNYRSLEIIVVDHASTDNTKEVLLSLCKKYPYLRSVEFYNTTGLLGKKGPLSAGIEHATNEHLLLTDADCAPISDEWIRSILSNISGEKTIVLGYSPYKHKAGLLNLFIRFETVYTGIQYLSFTLWGKPYMGVGRNLCYPKQLFYQVGGFHEHGHISSGDDDLFISSVANAQNTRISVHPDSFVESEPKESWSAYHRQKRRHMTTGSSYTLSQKFWLGLLNLSHVAFYVLLGWMLYFNLFLAVTVYSVRTLFTLPIYWLISDKLKDKNTKYYFLILDLMYVLFLIIHIPSITLKGKITTWK